MFSFLKEDEVDDDRYFRISSLLIAFFAFDESTTIISVDFNSNNSFSLSDLISMNFVKSLCEIFRVSLFKNDSLMS